MDDLQEMLSSPNVLASGSDGDIRPFFAALGIPAEDSVAKLQLTIHEGTNLVQLNYTRYVTRAQLRATLEYLRENGNKSVPEGDLTEAVSDLLELNHAFAGVQEQASPQEKVMQEINSKLLELTQQLASQKRVEFDLAESRKQIETLQRLVAADYE